MLARNSDLLPKKEARSPMKKHRRRWATGILLLAAVLTLGLLTGQRGVFVPDASAQSSFEDNVQRFKQDIQKFNEGIHDKVKSLINRLRRRDVPDGIVKTNGRIEATELDVSAKYAGRLESVTVNEGDEVKAGQVVAKIAGPEYQAQLANAQANVLLAKSALAAAEATVAQRKADQIFARSDQERGKDIVAQGWLTKQMYDARVAKADAADAALDAAQKQRDAARAAVQSTEAEVDRFNAVLTDLTLLAPRDGRVQYLIRRAGEVVGAGTRIITILDLNDVYMTIYLPAADAGKLALGDEARLILDPYPDLVIPARVSFVATDAQFTPKTVETAQEREKLIFRVKLQVDPEVLSKYYAHVKTGIRGVGFVRTAPVPWPANLEVKLPNG